MNENPKDQKSEARTPAKTGLRGTSIADAREQVVMGAIPLEPEEVSLTDAVGRFAAEEVTSRIDLPQFDNSAMDGFAVRAADLAGATPGRPVTLEVVGESQAGTPWEGTLAPGEVTGISTGAMMPAGADSVVRVEDVETDDGQVRFEREVPAGKDVRHQGEVAAAGAGVLAAGSPLGPVGVGLLATVGRGRVSCPRRPRVALLTTGDELVTPGEPLGPGQIWNSNQTALSALIKAAGAELILAETVPDDHDATVAALERALTADLTVVCGGVSVGEHDHVKPALAQLGVSERFWGLALKPGHPTWFGAREDSRVLGLPGNPVSTVVVFRLLGFPLLRALAGGGPEPRPRRARLSAAVKPLTDRLLVLPGSLADEDGDPVVTPRPTHGSHDFLSLRGADCLVQIPAGDDPLPAGSPVETIPLSTVGAVPFGND